MSQIHVYILQEAKKHLGDGEHPFSTTCGAYRNRYICHAVYDAVDTLYNDESKIEEKDIIEKISKDISDATYETYIEKELGSKVFSNLTIVDIQVWRQEYIDELIEYFKEH